MYIVTLTPDHLITNKAIADWRFELKMELLKKRGFRSDYSGKRITENTGCHLHEGILTRANVSRAAKNADGESWQYLIFHEVNCFLLLPEEHIPQPPSRDWCIQKSYEMYGRDAVREWFYSLPWKIRPPFKLL